MDTREKNTEITSILNRSRKVDLVTSKLHAGDFLIGNILIERKTVNDFHLSRRDNRLKNQSDYLLQLRDQGLVPYYLFEGDFNDLVRARRLSWSQINTILADIEIRKRISIIRTLKAVETAFRLIAIAQIHSQPNGSAMTIMRSSVKPEWDWPTKKRYIIQGFRGIGEKTADWLIHTYGTLYKIFEFLRNYIGKKVAFLNAQELLNA